MNQDRYTIRRNFQRLRGPGDVIRRNCTLEQAQAHCNDPETSSSTCTDPENKALTRKKGPWMDYYSQQ